VHLAKCSTLTSTWQTGNDNVRTVDEAHINVVGVDIVRSTQFARQWLQHNTTVVICTRVNKFMLVK